MKIWRIDYRGTDEHGDEGQSLGFDFHRRRRDAEAAVRSDERVKSGQATATIEAFEVRAGREGVIDALNRLAAHPDNG